MERSILVFQPRHWQLACWAILQGNCIVSHRATSVVTYIRNTSEIHQKYIRNTSEIHQKYIRNTSEIHQKYIRNTSEIHQKYLSAWNTCKFLKQLFLKFHTIDILSTHGMLMRLCASLWKRSDRHEHNFIISFIPSGTRKHERDMTEWSGSLSGINSRIKWNVPSRRRVVWMA